LYRIHIEITIINIVTNRILQQIEGRNTVSLIYYFYVFFFGMTSLNQICFVYLGLLRSKIHYKWSKFDWPIRKKNFTNDQSKNASNYLQHHVDTLKLASD